MLWRSPGISGPGSRSVSGERTQVDHDGTYEWFVPPEGSYTVEIWQMTNGIRSAGRQFKVHHVGPIELEAEEIKFTYAEGEISGTVATSDGTPIPNVRVYASPTSANRNRPLLSNPSPNTGKTKTGDDGTFTIEGLPDGHYRITASSTTFPKTHYSTSTEANVGEQNLNITICLLYTSPSPRDLSTSRMPSSA